jgi:uncharacterized protein (TIGR01244 family)
MSTASLAAISAAVSSTLPDAPPHFTRISDELLTAPQLCAADIAAIHTLGIKTVINLRFPDEEGFWTPPEHALDGVTLMHYPISGLGEEETKDAVVDRLLALVDAASKPVLLFCRSNQRAATLGLAYTATRKPEHNADQAGSHLHENMSKFLGDYVAAKTRKILSRPGILEVSPGLFVGAQPSEEELERFARGSVIRSVLNVRDPSEAGSIGMGVLAREGDICKRLSLEYRNVPVASSKAEDVAETVDAIRKALDDLPKPVLLHCAMRVRAEKVAHAATNP